ncbi:MAG: hypothetical protein K8S20_13005 [Chloroflexi bacterium]|nr:hypothetical protein [Chloroflexota bacterium]
MKIDKKILTIFIVLGGLFVFIWLGLYFLDENLPSVTPENEMVKLVNFRTCVNKNGNFVNRKGYKVGEDFYLCGKLISNLTSVELSLSISDALSSKQPIYTDTEFFNEGEIFINVPDYLSVGKYQVKLLRGRTVIGELIFDVD